jgi:uncharacterized protein
MSRPDAAPVGCSLIGVSWITWPCSRVYTYVYCPVRFTWDPDKSQLNLRERGFDFAFDTLLFDGPTVERVDNRLDYGENRVIAIGVADGIPLTVVYTDRAEDEGVVRRIISARVSDRRERKAYRQIVG